MLAAVLMLVALCVVGLCEDGDIRLVDGVDDLEGRIEICWKGSWGAVCSVGFGVEEAKIACKQLGYSRHGKTRSIC